MEISDAEDELGEALEEPGVEDAWELAPRAGQRRVRHRHPGQGARRRWARSTLRAALHWLSEAIEISQMLGEVTEATERITSLIASAKQYSQMDRAPFQVLDVHELLDSTVAIFRGKIPPGISVVTDYDRTLPPIPAYAGELNQVWTNLIHNALDAMGEEGTLTDPRPRTTRTRRSSRSATPAPACPRASGTGSSSRSSPPRPSARAPVSGWTSPTGSWPAGTAATCKVRSTPGDTWFEVRLPLRESTVGPAPSD